MEKFGNFDNSPYDREPRFPDEERIPRPQNDIMDERLAEARAVAFAADLKRNREQEAKPTNNQSLSQQERERNLDNRFSEIIKKQRLSGFPVDQKDGKIDINAFENAPNFGKSVIERDKDIIDRLDHDFKKDKQKSEGIGEKAEKMTSILFSKLLPDCDIVRTSKIDDEQGRFDRIDSMLFIDGRVVCAFDIAADFLREKRIENKEKKIFEQNKSGGVGAKYSFEKKGDEIIYKSEINIPIFGVKIDPGLLNKINFSNDAKFEKPEMELMCKVLVSIYNQIEDLEQILEKGGIQFDPEIDDKNIFIKRLQIFKEKLLKKISKDRAQKYLDEQEKQKPKWG